MELSPLLLTKLLIVSFIWGLIMGALNDVNRMLRAFCGVRYFHKKHTLLYEILRIRETNNGFIRTKIFFIIVFFQDISYVIIASLGMSFLNYYYNDGRFRFFSFIAMIFGAVLYYFTFGKVFECISEPFVLIIKKVITILTNVISAPFVRVFKILCKFINKLIDTSKKYIAKRRNIRYNKIKTYEWMNCSKYGFVKRE